MDTIVRVPQEMVNIIPSFNGDVRMLPLFIKKCEYILQTFQGESKQMEYLFHVITSRLSGEAAHLVGEREVIEDWNELKKILSEHFGDPRTEECIALELESAKINKGESYLEFCHRIQQIRSILFSKLSENRDDSLRQAKQHIYNHTSLNVFLYNLPSYLVRLVRLRNVSTLEDALKIVLEEQNFQTVYNSKNNDRNILNRTPKPQNYNFNPPRQQQFTTNNFNHQRNPSTQTPLSMPSTSFNSPNNSTQFRKTRSFNNFNNNQWTQTIRSPPQGTYTQPSQQNTPRMAPFNNISQPAAVSGSNTDVTMRTASSRRVNYVDTPNQYDPHNYNTASENNEPENSINNESGNFFIAASRVGNE